MDLEYGWIFIPGAALVVVATVILLMAGIIKSKRTVGVPLANTSRLTKSKGYRDSLRRRRVILVTVAAFLLVAMSSALLVASRPVSKTIETPVKYTRDIVLCLDVSGSMIETDIQIIQKFKDLIKSFNGERVSMVAFNSTASQVFPLTDDYAYVDKQLDYVFNGFFTNPPEPGYDYIKYTFNNQSASLIGDGLTACTMSFEFDDPDRSRSVILATDNVPNGESTVSLSDAVGLAKNNGVKVYSINPGSVDYETKEVLPEQESELQDVSENTDGQYFALQNENTISEIVNAISRDQTSEIKADPIVTKNDDPNLFLWIFLVISVPVVFVYRRLTR